MYSNIIRSDEYRHRLIEFIKFEYGINALAISPAKRGYYGETWRLDTKNSSYFIKLVYAATHIDTYERSFHVIQHLCDNGINFISKIVKSKYGDLFARFDGAILGVFNWIEGENIEADSTKIPEYQMLAKVYTVPTFGISIPSEDFSAKITDRFYEKWNELCDKQLLSLIEKNRTKIEHRSARLKHFSSICENETALFITHGDAGGNLIKNDAMHFIVDWDNPILAPPERDAWVMCSHDWARDAFHDALLQNDIKYTLCLKKLAYYCYYFFFFYLTAYLDGFTQNDSISVIEDYIDGWIEGSIEFADRAN
jgi:hypothetical protein